MDNCWVLLFALLFLINGYYDEYVNKSFYCCGCFLVLYIFCRVRFFHLVVVVSRIFFCKCMK